MLDTHGIHVIDTAFFRPRFDASHLIVENGRGAFIDVGTNYSVPLLLAGMHKAGLDAAAIDWIILTHVHLDHAGGAGELLRQLPNARVVVHPRGARHMLDPSALVAGASAVYGAEEVKRTYGDLVPVPHERLVEAPDGHVVALAGRPLLCLDTPGHARHHFSVWDETSRAFFPGDTFGLSYREFDTAQGAFIIPTTTPVQFDPQALHASIRRMISYAPQAMYLTHYSRVENVAKLAEDLHLQIDAMVAIANEYARTPDRHAHIMAGLARLYAARAQEHGCAMSTEEVVDILAMDIELNAQGLEVWLDREKRDPTS